jgi:magnesium transporter
VTTPAAVPGPAPTDDDLAALLLERSPQEAAALLDEVDEARAARVLAALNPASAVDIVWELPAERRARVAAAAPDGRGAQWLTDLAFPEGTVGRLMENPLAVFRPETRVAEAVERLRDLVRRALVTYGFVTETDGRLVGVFAFRELLFAAPGDTLASLMTRDPFALRPETTLVEAMREVVTRHYPAYPVCDVGGRLLGMVRGQALFERQAFEISAQAGSMVGVEKEERLATPWPRCLRFRHPWLQLNLLTAFVAAAVVGIFQETLDRLVVLAVFLPVLAGQSGNTGCQALAVTLRGMTLGELAAGRVRRLIGKEALLGLLNGLLVGLVAGGGMFAYAASQGHGSPLLLGAVVTLAMIGACVASGVAGTSVPILLRRLGADPATASSIFLTTATDVVSMGLFLGLATWLVR